MPPLLSAMSITRVFPGEPEVIVLRGVDLSLQPGEAAAIVGPSGSGKSTLLNIIGTLDRPTSGTVELDGRNVTELKEYQTASLRATLLGFVFQQHHLMPQCTVLENVLVPVLAAPKQTEGEDPEKRAARLLERVGLSHRTQHFPAQISGGERQRVALVRALINRPRLLLADEPTGALDRDSAENLTRLMLEINHEEQVALLVITHSETLASRMGRVLQMDDGRLTEVAAIKPK